MSQDAENTSPPRTVNTDTALAAGMIGLLGGIYVASKPYKPVTSIAELGSRVREARKAMNLTQQVFADLSGVGRRFVSELEAGKPTLEFDKALAVCRAAGIDLFSSQRSPSGDRKVP